MDMQFVFGNPIRKGLKKPLPKKKGSVKLTKAKKKENTQMAGRKRTVHHGKKNPTLYYYATGKNKKVAGGGVVPQMAQAGLPIPSKSEMILIDRFIKRSAELKSSTKNKPMSKAQVLKLLSEAEALGIDNPKIQELRDSIVDGGLESAYTEIMREVKSLGIAKRAALLKKYAHDVTKNSSKIKSNLKHLAMGHKLQSKTLDINDYQDDIDMHDYDESGLPGNFYSALAKQYRNPRSTTMKRKHKRNPAADFGAEDSMLQNSRRKGKKKAVKAKKTTKRKGSKAKTSRKVRKYKKATVTTTKRRKSRKTTTAKKTTRKKRFKVLHKGKAKWGGKGGVFSKIAKHKKGTFSVGGWKIRKNPDVVQTLIPGFHGVRPLAMLAGAAAFTGVLNGFIRFGLTKFPALQKITAAPGVSVVMPAVGPLVFAGLLAAGGRSKMGSKYANTLNEIAVALVTVSAVTLGVNALGGAVTNAMRKVFPTALAGYDGSLGLIPEGMAADVDMGDDMSGADFGDDMSGVSNFAGDDNIGDDMGDADFGADDFGDVDGDMDGVANFSGPSLG